MVVRPDSVAIFGARLNGPINWTDQVLKIMKDAAGSRVESIGSLEAWLEVVDGLP